MINKKNIFLLTHTHTYLIKMLLQLLIGEVDT